VETKAAEPVVETANFTASSESYNVTVDGKTFNVVVAAGGAPIAIQPIISEAAPVVSNNAASTGALVHAPMAGNILKILVQVGDSIAEGDVVVIMEAMKMETEIRSKFAGTVSAIHVKEGGAVAGGNALITL
jgi:oxaloacetate decarboxylase alpha subunit